MIRHIGLNINELSELEDFYINILGFKITEQFTARKEICDLIFNVKDEIPVYRLEKFGLELEIFVTEQQNSFNYQHLCIEYWKVAEIFEGASQKGYQTVTFLKDNGRRAYFVRDKAKNLIEIKEINHV